LLLERLCEVTVTCLQLLEEAHVLDGDDRLVGEGLEEIDLRLGERAGLDPADSNRSDRVAIPQHRDGEKAPQAARLPDARERVRPVVEQIRNLCDSARRDRASTGAAVS